jgi:type III secretion protein D
VWIGFFKDGAPWPDWPPAAIAAAQRREAASPGESRADTSAAAKPQQGLFSWLRKSLALCLVAAGAVLAVAGIASSAFERRSAPVAKQEARGTKGASDVLAAVLAGRAVSEDDLLAELKRQMGEQDLLQRVDFDFSADRLEMRANLDREEQERFERLLKKFDKTFHPKFEIVARIVPLKDLLPFKVVEATTGKGANVVTDSGDRLFVGDTLKGYRLAAVEPGKVTFTGRRHIEVAW